MTRLPFARTGVFLRQHGIDRGSPSDGTRRVQPRWPGRGQLLLAVCSIGLSLTASGCGKQQSSAHARAAATPTHARSSGRATSNRCLHAGAAASLSPSQLLAAARCAFEAQPAVEVSRVGAYVESGPVPSRVERESITFVQSDGRVRAYTSTFTTNLGVERNVFTGQAAAEFVPLDYEERIPHEPAPRRGWSSLFGARWLSRPASSAEPTVACLDSDGSLINPQERSLAIAGRTSVDGRPVVVLIAHTDPPTPTESQTLYIAATGSPLPLRGVLHQSAAAAVPPGCTPGPHPRLATDTFSYRPPEPITLPASTVTYNPQQVGTIVPPRDAAVVITPRGYTPITRATVAFWTRLGSSGALGRKWQQAAASGQVLTALITAQWTALQAAAAHITISNAQIAHELSSGATSLLHSAGIPFYILRATAENALWVARLGPSNRAHPQALRALAAADRSDTICALGATSSACRNG